jgi:hypothetical protein
MLPEEKVLTRLEAKQTKLQERVTAAELEFETLKIETARFRHRHYAAVGHLYAQLDEIEAKIANARAQLRPEDSTLKADARAANKRAKESAAEAGLMSANLKPTTAASPDLKQAYREAVKLVHPDLAFSNHERQRRTKLMAKINHAYELGDKGRIKKMIEEFGSCRRLAVSPSLARPAVSWRSRPAPTARGGYARRAGRVSCPGRARRYWPGCPPSSEPLPRVPRRSRRPARHRRRWRHRPWREAEPVIGRIAGGVDRVGLAFWRRYASRCEFVFQGCGVARPCLAERVGTLASLVRRYTVARGQGVQCGRGRRGGGRSDFRRVRKRAPKARFRQGRIERLTSGVGQRFDRST